ncbi:MAG: hypothetical protein ACKO7B_14770, partial [Flavobacteriales bacterium]
SPRLSKNFPEPKRTSNCERSKTKDLNCEINVIANNADVIVAGGLVFDRSQFDVRFGSGKFFDNLGDNLIEDEITLKLDIKGKKQ